MGGQVVSLALVPAVEDHVAHLALPVAESLGKSVGLVQGCLGLTKKCTRKRNAYWLSKRKATVTTKYCRALIYFQLKK